MIQSLSGCCLLTAHLSPILKKVIDRRPAFVSEAECNQKAPYSTVIMSDRQGYTGE